MKKLLRARSPGLDRFLDRISRMPDSRGGRAAILGAIFSYILGVFFLHLQADIDLFARIASGRLVYLGGSAPSVDLFAYTPHTAWHDHPWLSGAVFYLVAASMGDTGLFLLKCFIAAVTILIVHHTARVATGTRYPGLILWLIFVISPDLIGIWIGTIRAQVFAYLYFSIFLLAFVLVRHRSNYRLFATLPAVAYLWVNCHGSYVIGLGFLGVFTLCSYLQHRSRDVVFITIVALCCAPIPFMTPYGADFLRFSTGQITQRPYEILEWMPVYPFTIEGFHRYSLAALMVAGIWIGGRKLLPLEGWCFMLLSGFWGFHHGRLSPTFSMTCACYGIPLIAAVYERIKTLRPHTADFVRRGSILGGGVMACWGLGMSATSLVARPFSLDYSPYPVATIEWLWNNYDGGRILTHYNDGGFVMMRVAPRFQISFDGRYDGLYPPETRELGYAVYMPGHPRQQEALKAFWPDFVLIGDALPGMCRDTDTERAKMFPGFRLIHSDGRFCLLIAPNGPTPRAVPATGTRSMWAFSF